MYEWMDSFSPCKAKPVNLIIKFCVQVKDYVRCGLPIDTIYERTSSLTFIVDHRLSNARWKRKIFTPDELNIKNDLYSVVMACCVLPAVVVLPLTVSLSIRIKAILGRVAFLILPEFNIERTKRNSIDRWWAGNHRNDWLLLQLTTESRLNGNGDRVCAWKGTCNSQTIANTENKRKILSMPMPKEYRRMEQPNATNILWK